MTIAKLEYLFDTNYDKFPKLEYVLVLLKYLKHRDGIMVNCAYFRTIINNARVARLATIDSGCKPYMVPVVFVCDNDDRYYIPIDEKFKKSSEPGRLKRLRNIEANPNVALLIDEYTEDWAKLYFIMIQGIALLVGNKSEQDQSQNHIERAHKLLSEKYFQYREVGIGDYVIMIYPQKVITWKNH